MKVKVKMARDKTAEFRRLQSKHSTSQCNGRRLTCCGRRRKHWIKISFQKLSFNPLVLTQ